MPTLKDIRRRIRSVEKTQQITSAMRMVAAAKLRRATQAIEAARPYAERMRSTLTEVVSAQTDAEHPLLEVRDPVRTLCLVVITSDRGLAGAFNGNVLKHAEAILAEREPQVEQVSLVLAGRKAADYFRRRRAPQIHERYETGGWVSHDRAVEIARGLAARFESGEVDEVVLVVNEFVSTLAQRPTHTRLLPFTAESNEASVGGEAPLPYTIEPSPERLLATLVPRAVEVAVFRALLENQAGEHAARMTAMESATRNTEELIERLTMDYNRARQAAITKELMEIVSGAEAL
ncbi:MAG: ATP synthase F1 subunit gamma [Proteobacteria bacterium]|nr:ATP synthase F1 subunit gamma [Pseudomonadota bacterium]